MDFPNEMTLAARIKMTRVIKGQTQTQMATELGTTQKQVYLWEAGYTEHMRKGTKAKLLAWAGGHNLFGGTEI